LVAGAGVEPATTSLWGLYAYKSDTPPRDDKYNREPQIVKKRVLRDDLPMRVAILGFAREGKSVLKFIKKDPRFRNAEIWILDKNPAIDIPRGLKWRLGKSCLKNLTAFDLVFRSPGVPYSLPELKTARRRGVKFSSLTKLFFEKSSAKIIGVTGTKGKGTTSTLLYHILKAAHLPSALAGNIGRPALEILPRLRKSSWIVLELSSFQLQDLTASPHIAVILDVFPDHQDAHRSLREYYEAKTSIARHQKKNDLVFFFEDNALSRLIAQKSKGRKIAVSPKRFAAFRPDDLAMKGWHNFRNAVMAATVAKKLGVRSEVIRKAVMAFRGIEHRLEFVRKVTVRPASPKLQRGEQAQS